MSESQVRMYLDGNLPVIVGECPRCKNGDRGLVLVDYVHNPNHENSSTIYMKCIQCTGVWQTNIDSVTGE